MPANRPDHARPNTTCASKKAAQSLLMASGSSLRVSIQLYQDQQAVASKMNTSPITSRTAMSCAQSPRDKTTSTPTMESTAPYIWARRTGA